MADLNSLKKELTKLTNIAYLKKELNRIAGEIRKFDVHITLTPQAKGALKQLEGRFRDILKKLNDLQSQVDSNMTKFRKIVAKTRAEAEKKIRRSVGLGSARKTSTRKTTSTKKAARKATATTTKKSPVKTSRKTSKKITP